MFAAAALAAFALLAAWAITVPLYSAPDETSQVVHAAALVRGQLIGRPGTGAQNPYSTVRVPASFGKGEALVKCYQFDDREPASCASGVRLTSGSVPASTYSGHYPPLYFALTGLPTLVDRSTGAVFLMRLSGALLCAVLLGLACLAVVRWSRHRAVLVGLMAALTPTALYLQSVVNPNGLEIAAALCLWCSGLVLVTERLADPPVGLIAIVGASAAVLNLARPLSPLWTLLILATLALLAGVRQVWRLLRRTDVRMATAAVAASAAFAVAWIIGAHSLWIVPAGTQIAHGTPLLHIVGDEFRQTGTWLEQMVGMLGWLDAPVPLATSFLWAAAVGVLLVGVLATRQWRDSGILALLVVAVLVAPVALELIDARRVGLAWQGRYTLPLAVGVPLLSSALIGKAGQLRRLSRSLGWVVLAFVSVGGILAFAEVLRRYAVGVNGPILFVDHGWTPLEGDVGALIWFVVATIVLAGLLGRWASRRRRRPSLVSPPEQAHHQAVEDVVL